MKKAGELTSLGAKAALDAVDVGKKEFEIAADAEYVMRKRGAGGTAFDTIVASGPRSAWPHGTCDDRIIQKGDAIVIDIGAVYKGYRSDITRTSFAGPLSERQKEVYKTVLVAQREATKKAVRGAKTSEVDKVARSFIIERGYGKFFTHGTGHGVGIDIHEPPRLTVTGEDILVPGNVVTVEPGIYLPGSFGVRIEDTLLIKEEGNEAFTTCDKLMI
jgi:Xaa-Pro aminopeptidase